MKSSDQNEDDRLRHKEHELYCSVWLKPSKKENGLPVLGTVRKPDEGFIRNLVSDQRGKGTRNRALKFHG
ncbi:hypothetical protein DPMN_058312 [Dreissena polymorpha]|uniref:Uncharacterized protein n=1 Tax=Dreissena polymorpha TaxID=45954 RepID=A0A9D4C1S7_DREPO|nr:hypothetical protein DPMN_058312 [Dreissena polymorpha]